MEETTLTKRLGAIIILLCSQTAMASKPPVTTERSGNSLSEKLMDVRTGDTVSTVLSRFGFSTQSRDRLITESQIPDDYRLIPQEKYLVSVDPKKNLTEVRFFEARDDRSYVFWRRHNDANGADLQIVPLETRVKEISGRVVGSILSSILSFVPNNWVATRFMDAYAFEQDTARDLQKGARFGLRVEEKYWKGRFIKYGEVIKTSLEMNGQLQDRHFLRVGQGGVFIDEQMREQRRPLYSPVPYMRISSAFQPRRYHPVRHRVQAHLGTDFELAWGTPVFAAQAGQITKMGLDRASGYFVVVRHMSGFESSYSHLRKLPAHLRAGMSVRAGQTIGEVGCTGYCTMPHLHFAVKRYGQWIDPMFAIKNYPSPYEEQVLEQVSHLRKKIARKD